MLSKFAHFELRLINPAFTSPLVDVLTDLEHLRKLNLAATTPLPMFLELKQVFHVLESLASARIEGNHTTLSDYVDAQLNLDKPQPDEESWKEIDNIEQAMQLLESEVSAGSLITEGLLRQLHGVTVRGLDREGDRTPGAYRLQPVKIAQAQHLPPEAIQVQGYMQELLQFINQSDPSKYDLIKIAVAHHRFAWIHPFGNGNGRLVRLLTYAMLIKYGFQVDSLGRLLNPAAVFCADRQRYYTMLAQADDGTDAALEAWCSYVLTGVRDEMKKIERLARFEYLQQKILIPALAFAVDREHISKQEHAILLAVTMATDGIIKTAELAEALPKLNSQQRTYKVSKLLEMKMLKPIKANARQYTLGFVDNNLLRGVIRSLRSEGFISDALQGSDM
jgi:Fic family protein